MMLLFWCADLYNCLATVGVVRFSALASAGAFFYFRESFMDQSDRIRGYKNYMYHPLRFEYEKKKRNIISKRTQRFLDSATSIPQYLAIIYGLVFVFSIPLGLLGDEIGWGAFGFVGAFMAYAFFGSIPLGIINLIFIIFEIPFGDDLVRKIIIKKHGKQLQQLREEYMHKGLYEYTLDDIYSEHCGEYNDYDILVCSVTKQPLALKELNICNYNCKNCEKLKNALSIDLNIVRENERNFNISERQRKEKEASKQAEMGSNNDDWLLQETPELKKQKKKEKIRSAAFIAFVVISIAMDIILEKLGL